MPVQTQMQVRRGTASSWTSTNPTLAAGELGFETDTGKFKIGTGASTWTALSYAGGGQNTLTTYQYTATGAQTTFSGVDANGNTLAYTAGAVQVYLNGALLQNTADYAASTGTSVVLTTGALVGDSLTILSLGSFTVSTDIPKSTLTAKGSIVAASGASTPANLSVGANDTVLTADSSTATGLKWAAPASGGGMTLLSTTTLSGTTTTISSISQDYTNLFIVINGISAATAHIIQLLPNGEAALCNGSGVSTSTATSYTSEPMRISGNQTTMTSNSTANAFACIINNYASTTNYKPFQHFGGRDSSVFVNFAGVFRSNSAVSSLTFNLDGTTFTAGTVLLYGVK
jgi:hypothetical protein